MRTKPGKALCKPEEHEFQGVNVYLEGANRFSYNKELAASNGGIGFTAYSGVAMSKRLVRNVVVTSASDSAPNQKVSFGKDNTYAWHSESEARRASAKIAGFPKVQSGTLLLTPFVPHWHANSVLVDDPSFARDYSVEFEYSIQNKDSSDPQKTGHGFVFLFGKDASRFKNGPAPGEDVNAFQADSGCGIHFEVYQTRSIQLKGSCLEKPGEPIKANLIHGLPDVYTDGLNGLNEWRTVRVEVRNSSKRVQLFYEGVEVLDEKVILNGKFKAIGFASPVPAQFKFEAAAEHKVRNVVVRPLTPKGR